MAKFINVPRPSALPESVGDDFLQQRIAEQQIPQVSVPSTESTSSVPPPLAYTGIVTGKQIGRAHV